jgi:hypothetical protein
MPRLCCCSTLLQASLRLVRTRTRVAAASRFETMPQQLVWVGRRWDRTTLSAPLESKRLITVPISTDSRGPGHATLGSISPLQSLAGRAQKETRDRLEPRRKNTFPNLIFCTPLLLFTPLT